jgi:hypothetical protein
MERSKLGKDSLVVSAMCFGFGAFLAWALMSDHPGPAKASIEWPAWVQAVGSVLAILAAIGIAMWQRQVERADRKVANASAAKSLGVVVLREVRELRNRLLKAPNKVREPFHETQGKPIPNITIPQALWDVAPALHTLGRPSDAVTSALFHLQEARELAQGGLLWGEHSAQYIRHMTHALDACDLAIEQLRATLGGAE